MFAATSRRLGNQGASAVDRRRSDFADSDGACSLLALNVFPENVLNKIPAFAVLLFSKTVESLKKRLA
jgi:hypothetical protein